MILLNAPLVVHVVARWSITDMDKWKDFDGLAFEVRSFPPGPIADLEKVRFKDKLSSNLVDDRRYCKMDKMLSFHSVQVFILFQSTTNNLHHRHTTYHPRTTIRSV